jgi:hypothetical protein
MRMRLLIFDSPVKIAWEIKWTGLKVKTVQLNGRRYRRPEAFIPVKTYTMDEPKEKGEVPFITVSLSHLLIFSVRIWP